MTARRIALIAFFLIAAVAPIRPLQDFDYFWHLATGRWILEHHALPLHDPFAVASDRVPWINGEWLFEILIYPLGVNGMIIARALFIGILFTALIATIEAEFAIALALCTFAWFEGIWAFSERPATFACGFLVIAIWLALRKRSIVAYALLTIVWMNFHPSALLAPIIALLCWRIGMCAASALALLVNPWGIEGILAPQRLAHWVATGPFKNLEWQPALPSAYPFFYVMLALALLAFAFDRDRRKHIPHFLLLALFGALAIRFIRNHAMFYAVWPMLIAPMIPRLTDKRMQRVVIAASFAFLLLFLASRRPSLGVNPYELPVHAVAQLAAMHPTGNIFATDRFGGLLIWTFYPERRVVYDNRNELYHAFLTEYTAANRDSRKWQQLITKYGITTAVVEYGPPIVLRNARTGVLTSIPFDRAFYPRAQWELIARDDVAMVFAKRR